MGNFKTTPKNHPNNTCDKQPFFSFNFFTDFLHLCPGGGPAQMFAHPHAHAPPLHRDLGLCHGLLNHANFSKLTPWQKKIRYHKNYWQSDLFTAAYAYGLNLMSISKRSKLKLSWLWYIVQTPYCKVGFSEIKMIKTSFIFSVLNISMSFHRWNIFYLFFCMMS